MCGILGVLPLNDNGKSAFKFLNDAVRTLQKRGPDNNATYIDDNIALAHTRLSVIDTSEKGNQPFFDKSGRYIIVFNGEFYNYKEYREKLLKKGIKFHSNTDTEVLLYLFINEGIKCLKKINGFFAFAIYDKYEKKLILARDRFGIKPLYLYEDNNKIIFASQLNTFFKFPVNKDIDLASLCLYMQLTYVPSPFSILKNVKKISPGSYQILQVKNKKLERKSDKYYTLPQNNKFNGNYEDAKKTLKHLLEESVKLRLISDVPVGSFLSGGIDSSIISSIASKYKNNLDTFTVGIKNNKFLDESKYAKILAKKINSNHHCLMIGTNEMLESINNVLDNIDEPFADSSSIAVYIISKYAREKVKVILSGDGGDELFAGYNKYKAFYNSTNFLLLNRLLKYFPPIYKILPKSRKNAIENKIRQFERYIKGIKLNCKERYWYWSTFTEEKDALSIIKKINFISTYLERKNNLTVNINDKIDSVLRNDIDLVLENDMLVKTDRMSMALSLELRVPFLDHNIVNFANSIPVKYKINAKEQKIILKDAFKNILPKEILYHRKQGFEVPLDEYIMNIKNNNEIKFLFSKDFIENQNIFNYNAINNFFKKNSKYLTTFWSLLVFNYWYRKYYL